MSSFARLLLIFFLLSMLCSCAAIRRETGIIDPHKEQTTDFIGAYTINGWPTASLSSSCLGGFNVTIGPWIVLPFPVIPNPLSFFDYAAYKKRPADMTLRIEAKAKEHNWNNAHIEMIINGNKLTTKDIKDESTEWLIKRQYSYQLGITCKELENSEIIVQITDVPIAIESHLKYTYRWRIYTDGI